MKKHMENYLHALEGISARLNHVETSVDELKVSVRNNHGSTDGKMRQLENIPREVFFVMLFPFTLPSSNLDLAAFEMRMVMVDEKDMV